MRTEQWIEYASFGNEVNACIPLGYQPTLPQLYRSDNDSLQIRFYYYRVNMSNGNVRIGMPSYTISFSLDRQITYFKKLNADNTEYFQFDELGDNSFEERQKAYIEQLDKALEQGILGNEELQELKNRWLEANPNAVRKSLKKLTDTV